MILSRLLGRKSKTIDQIAEEIDGFGGVSAAGQVVTERTALQVATVLACVDVIASGISVPELHVMRRLANGQKEVADDLPVYRVLHRRPNEWQTSFEFRETLTMHAALTGNAYAVPVRDVRSGEITEIWPVMPHQVTIEHVGRYDLVYTINDEFGVIGRFRPEQILHLRNRSWDRIRGMSAVRQAASAIGLAMAAEENMAKLHENAGRPAGILTTDQKLGAEAVDRIKAGWMALTQGVNRFKTAVLDNGVTYSPISMTAVDAQSIETRRLQVEEICRAFGVFPIMVGHNDKSATYASAEAFFAANNRKTVAKWQRIWAEKLDEFVLDGAGPLFAEFDNDEFGTASLRDQAEFAARALGTGGGAAFMEVNEVRALKGLPPVAWGNGQPQPQAALVAEDGAQSPAAPEQEAEDDDQDQ